MACSAVLPYLGRLLTLASDRARSRAHRARQLGWVPKYDINDLWAYIRPEAEVIIKETQA